MSKASAPQPAVQDDEVLLSGPQVRAMFGGVSDMMLWRWTHDRGFPKPTLYICGRRYWQKAAVRAWRDGHATPANLGS